MVYVCPRFLRAWKRERARGEVTLVHEALHTLGLGENPPARAGITDTIASCCGRGEVSSSRW